MFKKSILFFFIASFGVTLHPQFFKPSSEKKLLNHIKYLADDKLEGRLTGSAGEMLAAIYISKTLKSAGAKPGNGDSYIQEFEFTESVEPTEKTWLKVNGTLWTGGTDYYPIDGTANAMVDADLFFAGFGIKAPELNYNDYEGKGDRKGKIFIIELGAPDGNHPHSKYVDYLKLDKKITIAKEEGAAAILFINKGEADNDPSAELNPKVSAYDIPILFLKRNLDYLEDDVSLQVEVERKKGIGHNVLGFIDNKATNTIVIGAHYDHLGYGGSHSLYRGEPAVHNGADDNASGTSLMMELAAILKKSKWKNNNYLFIAFSGEELGLYGSSFFTKSQLMEKYKINYMLNMDMVGRLDTTDQTLLVNGAGTSPAWKVVMKEVQFGNDTNIYKVKTTEGGVGPSDQTSFYFKEIPAIHFFSGTHNDYHKPTDDWEKINTKGMRLIGDYMLHIIEHLNDDGKLAFTKTQDTDGKKAAGFKVTLGVVPDYAYEGEGLKVDGVTDGKPASIAGIIAGDIIMQLGEYPIKDIYAYMGALGKFKKGDVVTVTLLRGKDTKILEVKF
jgi:aminopeptidase YwaD